MGCEVRGSWCGVWGMRFGVRGVEYEVRGVRCGVWGMWICRVCIR